jgi:altronate dehydratase
MNKPNWLKLILVGLMIIMGTGCSDKSQEKAAEKATEGTKTVTEKTSEMAKEALDETKEAVATATNWTKEKTEAYSAKMGEQLNGFNDKFKDLTAKAEGLSGDAKEKFKEQFAVLTEKKDAAVKELEALKDTSGNAWTAAKERFETVMKELKELYDKMVAEFTGN